ncbi:MAG: class I SAM-dependent RNA methyltransferase [Rhodospirillales bacterium]
MAGGATLEVTIERIGAGGDGIADGPHGRLYVPATVAGDRVRVRPLARRGEGQAAELLEVVVAGPGRATPACPHFGRCGGCSLQHLDDAAYEDWKLARVRTALARAGIAAAEMAPLARTAPGGRRRAVFVAERPPAGGPARLGFNVRRGHAVVDIEACPVLAPSLFALTPALRALMGELLPPGGRSTLSATALAAGVDLVVGLPAPPGVAVRERLARFAEETDLARLSWRHGEGARDITPEPVVQRRPATVRFGGVPVEPPPGGFLQASEAGERALVAAVLAATQGASPGASPGAGQPVGLKAGRIADLFCGAGTFSLPLAMGGGAQVDAIDGDAGALAALSRASRAVPQVRCERRDLFAQPLTATELQPYGAVVFDPPRSGAAAQANALAASRVPVVVAVSCNVETFARDARTLAAGGYRLIRITIVDQFLWNPHVEVCAVFQR